MIIVNFKYGLDKIIINILTYSFFVSILLNRLLANDHCYTIKPM